jgi:hypothetical protein
MASTLLSRTPSGAGNRRIWTWSAWVKKSSDASSNNSVFCAGESTDDQFNIFFRDVIILQDETSNVANFTYQTNRKFRDLSAWYHLVVSVDTTQSTASDRVKIYINGTQETSFSTSDDPAQNLETNVNRTINTSVGGRGYSNSSYFDGLLSHVHFIDGTAYDASAFGQTDANGVWTINTSPSVTYGTNGFFILKNGNSVTDQSGNGNNFTVASGTLTNTEDNPSNVFCTINPLARGDFTNNATLSNGNTYYSSDTAGYNIRVGTLGASSGKYYWEGKFISHNPTTSPGMPLGIIATDVPIGTNIAGGQAPYYYSYNYDGSNGTVILDSVVTNYGTTILDTVGQIGMVAMDLDNNKVYFGVDGTWTNSADPSAGTGGFSITDPADTPLGFYIPAISDRSSAREYVYAWNFGNGYFGTTAVSSAGTNASGNGIFEYDVPTGYTALSTKGLNL